MKGFVSVTDDGRMAEGSWRKKAQGRKASWIEREKRKNEERAK
jgi:hypothetical protein